MWPDRVSNPGHLAHESEALPTPNFLNLKAKIVLKLRNDCEPGPCFDFAEK